MMRSIAAVPAAADFEAFEGSVLSSASPGRDVVDGAVVALVGAPADVARTAPGLAAHAQRLKIFQRQGAWVVPAVAAAVPRVVQDLVPRPIRAAVTVSVARAHLRRQVPDEWMRRQLTPPGDPRRREVVCSDRFYRLLARPDVELVTWPIAGVVPAGIRTADGLEHRVDVIVVAG